MRILPRSGRDCLRGAVAGLLGGAAGRVALDDENLRALRRRIGAVGELARQAQLAHRGLARNLLFLPAADALVGALDHEIEQLVGLCRIAGKPMIERVLDRLFDDARGLGGGQAILGLALELGLADEHRQHAAGAGHHVVRRDRGRALALSHALGVVLQAAGQGAAQARLVRAAVRRRNGIAIRRQEAVDVGGPGDRPFGAAMLAGLARTAGEDVGMHERRALELRAEVVLEAVGEMKVRRLRHAFDAAQQLRRTRPSDFDAADRDRPWSATS